VKFSVRGRDLASAVAEAQQKTSGLFQAPYRADWAGEFQQMEEATNRLLLIVPISFVLIAVLLYLAFRSVLDAIVVLLNVLALSVGGFWALVLTGTNFNISAAVGYIAVFGVSVLNGVVLVSSIRQARTDGLAYGEAIVRGCEIRFRAIVVSGIVAVVGFLPAALSHDIGAEIQRPLARVVIGGLVTATAMTLLVLPAIYATLARRAERGSAAE